MMDIREAMYNAFKYAYRTGKYCSGAKPAVAYSEINESGYEEVEQEIISEWEAMEKRIAELEQERERLRWHYTKDGEWPDEKFTIAYRHDWDWISATAGKCVRRGATLVFVSSDGVKSTQDQVRCWMYLDPA
jgi:hypothetical protein